MLKEKKKNLNRFILLRVAPSDAKSYLLSMGALSALHFPFPNLPKMYRESVLVGEYYRGLCRDISIAMISLEVSFSICPCVLFFEGSAGLHCCHFCWCRAEYVCTKLLLDHGVQYRGWTGNGRRSPMVRRMRETLDLGCVEVLVQSLSTTAVTLCRYNWPL